MAPQAKFSSSNKNHVIIHSWSLHLLFDRLFVLIASIGECRRQTLPCILNRQNLFDTEVNKMENGKSDDSGEIGIDSTKGVSGVTWIMVGIFLLIGILGVWFLFSFLRAEPGGGRYGTNSSSTQPAGR